MRKIITILLVIGMSISLIACGGNESSDKETDTKESADKVEVELEYYEEYETLPTADSIISADYKGKTSTMTGDNAGLTVYKYGGEDGVSVAELIESYIKALEEEGFTTDGTVDTEIAIIDKEVIIASVTDEDGVMNVSIIPENSRMSSKVETISIGDVITTNDYELTLKNVEFTYEVLPPNTSSVYTSYPAESGKVYVHVSADVKNIMQRDIRIEELFTANVLYDGKYKYNGFTIVDDDNGFDWVESYVAATPLETCGAHSLIECPVEVDTSGKPVSVTITIGNTNYEYVLR